MTFNSPYDVPSVLREALYIQVLYRHLGFTADDIFLEYAEVQLAGVDEHPKPSVFMTVKQDDKILRTFAGATDIAADKIDETWTAAVTLWNRTSNSDKRWNYERSSAAKHSNTIISAIQAQGLKPPAMVN